MQQQVTSIIKMFIKTLLLLITIICICNAMQCNAVKYNKEDDDPVLGLFPIAKAKAAIFKTKLMFNKFKMNNLLNPGFHPKLLFRKKRQEGSRMNHLKNDEQLYVWSLNNMNNYNYARNDDNRRHFHHFFSNLHRQPTHVIINNNHNVFTDGLKVHSESSSSSKSESLLQSPYLLHFPRLQHRHVRSLPLARLVVDPNAKLDMTRTLENIGNVAKNALEDKRSPPHHIKNMIGSVRDAFISSIKMAPQGLIVPTQYRIVNSDEEAQKVKRDEETYLQKAFGRKKKINESLLRSAAYKHSKEEDPYNFLGTFKKLGSVVRESVKAGHETMEHMNSAAHSARKAYTTTKLALPKVLLPMSRAPVLEKRLTLISPRFLNVDEDAKLPEKKQASVRMADILDAIGISNPEREKVPFKRIVIQDKNPFLLQSRNNFVDDDEEPQKNLYIISENIDDDDAGDDVNNGMINTESIMDYLDEMKREIFFIKKSLDKSSVRDDETREEWLKRNDPIMQSRSAFSDDAEELDNEVPIATTTQQPQNEKVIKLIYNEGKNQQRIFEDKQISPHKNTTVPKKLPSRPIKRKEKEDDLSKFLHNLFTKDRMASRNGNIEEFPKKLMKPFMNQASKGELDEYFKAKRLFQRSRRSVDERLEAINPETYKRIMNSVLPEVLHDEEDALRGFKEALGATVKNNKVLLHARGSEYGGYGDYGDYDGYRNEDERRTAMKISKKLLEPYMGKVKYEEGEIYNLNQFYPYY